MTYGILRTVRQGDGRGNRKREVKTTPSYYWYYNLFYHCLIDSFSVTRCRHVRERPGQPLHPIISHICLMVCEPSSCNVETLTMERFLLSSNESLKNSEDSSLMSWYKKRIKKSFSRKVIKQKKTKGNSLKDKSYSWLLFLFNYYKILQEISFEESLF